MTQYCTLEEAFSNYSPISRKKKVPVEKFEAQAPKKTYSSQRSDYDYICENAGICVYPDKFESGSSPSPAPKKCEPLQPPKYDYPFSEEDKRRFRQALKIALEEMESGSGEQSTPIATAQAPAYAPRAYNNTNVDMSGVNGYIDEELESYMMVNDMKPAITKESLPEHAKTEPLQGIEGSLTGAPLLSPAPAPSSSQQLSYTRRNRVWFELLLFSIGGILIILLLEQIFKIAHESGVKKTIVLLEKLYHYKKSLECM